MYKVSSDNHFSFLHFFLLRMVLITAFYIMLRTSIYSSLGKKNHSCCCVECRVAGGPARSLQQSRCKVSTAWPGGGRQRLGTGPAGTQAEGRPEALQSSGLLPGLGCSPVGARGSLPESQTSQHRKRVPRFIGEMEGEQEARELGDMGRCALLPGRGQRPRQRKGGVPPQAASPSGATRGAEQRRG